MKAAVVIGDTELEKMWDELADIPFDDPGVDQDLVLAEHWRGFKKGTARENIWHWFDQFHSKGVAYLLNKKGGNR